MNIFNQKMLSLICTFNYHKTRNVVFATQMKNKDSENKTQGFSECDFQQKIPMGKYFDYILRFKNIYIFMQNIALLIAMSIKDATFFSPSKILHALQTSFNPL